MYSKRNRVELTIKTLSGLEPVLAQELAQLGAKDIKTGGRVVYCTGDQRLLYRANLELRTALKVLKPIAQFRAYDEQHLYKYVRRKIPWSEFMDVTDTLAIDAVTKSDKFRHSKFVALKVKDAIVDEFRRLTDDRPNVDTRRPTLRINVHINDLDCTISLDSSGDSLHQRGYRKETGEAPLNEVLAAGMLLHAQYTGNRPLLDPMCGSGTILIESALIAANKAPGSLGRDFGFLRWKDFDADLWQSVKSEARQRERIPQQPIIANDQDFRLVRMAQRNAMNAGIDTYIEFGRQKMEKRKRKPFPHGLLIVNPPYDERLEDSDIEGTYKMMGDQFKHIFPGWTAWVISSNISALKSIGLRATQKKTLYNGPLECKFMKFDLYEGKKGKGSPSDT